MRGFYSLIFGFCVLLVGELVSVYFALDCYIFFSLFAFDSWDGREWQVFVGLGLV